MELFLQITALCVLCAALMLLVRKQTPELAFCAAAGCCALCLLTAKTFVQPVLEFLQELRVLANVQQAILTPILKTVGVGILTQLAGAFCKDAGDEALCKVIELCGTFLALYVSLPLASAVLELLQKMIGG